MGFSVQIKFIGILNPAMMLIDFFRYKAGIHVLQEHASAMQEEHEERLRAISVLRMNISVGHIQLQDPASAKKELTTALADGFCPLPSKAYLR